MQDRMAIIVKPCSKCHQRTGLIFKDKDGHYVKCLYCKRETARYAEERTAFTEWNNGNISLPPEV